MAWLEIILAWGVLAAIFVGVGALVFSVLRPAADDRCTPFSAFWLGWCVCIGFLQIWHCIWRINGAVIAVLGALAVVGLVRARAQSVFGRQSAAGYERWLTWILSLLWIAFVANRAIGPPINPDTCLYHMQASRWASEYPIVPGLANFNLLLGFNNAYQLYVAMLDVGPFHHQAQHLANGILYLAAALPGLAATVRLLRPTRDARALQRLLIWATIFGLSIDQFLGSNLSSPSADAAVWSLDVALVMLCLEPYFQNRAMSAHRVRVVALISGAALAAKSSTVVVALPFCLYVFASWYRDSTPDLRRAARQLLAATGLAAASVVPWVMRNVLMSGYPLFPSTFLPSSASWQVPHYRVDQLVAYIRAYARYQHVNGFEHVSHGPWVAHWLAREWLNDRTTLIPAIVILGSGCALIVLGLLRRQWPPLAAAALPLICTLAFWWLTAPDTRFLDPLQWITAAVLFLCAWSYARPEPQWVGWLVCLGLVLGIQAAGLYEYSGALRLRPAGALVDPGPESYSLGVLPSGEEVRVYRGSCLDVPCGFNLGHVHSRVQGELQRGFYSDELSTPR